MSVKEGGAVRVYRFPVLRAVVEFLSRGLASWMRLLGEAQPYFKLKFGTEAQPFIQVKGGREAFEQLYSIGEKIGQGSFGQVFACSSRSRWLPMQGPLCVKVVPLTGRHSSRISQLKEQEQAELLSAILQLRHPHLLRCHKFVKTSDQLFTVMDRYSGPELSDHVEARGGSLPIEEVRILAQQILSAITALQAVNLMHRDIKLENFRFSDQQAETLKLLDFGFAKVASASPGQHTVTGTLLYAAPEIFDGIYAHSCDLWSVGIVLFFLLSGELPFQTPDVTILRSMHRDPVLNGDSLFRGKRWREMPARAKSLIRGLLQVDPIERLTATAAEDHDWFFELEDDGENTARSRGLAPVGSLRSLSSLSRSWNELRSLAGLKRSEKNFQWDLTDAAMVDDGS